MDAESARCRPVRAIAQPSSALGPERDSGLRDPRYCWAGTALRHPCGPCYGWAVPGIPISVRPREGGVVEDEGDGGKIGDGDGGGGGDRLFGHFWFFATVPNCRSMLVWIYCFEK